jgi:hypothetical protein
MKSSVTREGVLSGGNRVQARSTLRDLILLCGGKQPPIEWIDNCLDEIALYALLQVEQDLHERYGGQNEGV